MIFVFPPPCRLIGRKLAETDEKKSPNYGRPQSMVFIHDLVFIPCHSAKVLVVAKSIQTKKKSQHV